MIMEIDPSLGTNYKEWQDQEYRTLQSDIFALGMTLRYIIYYFRNHLSKEELNKLFNIYKEMVYRKSDEVIVGNKAEVTEVIFHGRYPDLITNKFEPSLNDFNKISPFKYEEFILYGKLADYITPIETIISKLLLFYLNKKNILL